MNKELNLVEILKDAPEGTKLYSTIYGEVEFKYIDYSAEYPIYFTTKYSGKHSACDDGRDLKEFDGECTLFPSKDNRDWSTFKRPMQDGDIVVCVVDEEYKQYFVFKEWIDKENDFAATYIFVDEGGAKNNGNGYIDRLATEEEIKQFHSLLEEHGYKWDSKNKELVSKKFDPNTFQPFDKVLARDSSKQKWRIDFFEKIRDVIDFKYRCMNDDWALCIPYNEETKHLLGTNKEAPDFYNI